MSMIESSQASLTVVTSPSLSPGTRFLLGPGRCRIGRRASNDIRLDEANVADEHAKIEHRYGRFIVETLTEGALTSVNREPIRESRRLLPGDTLEIAGTCFLFNLVATSERRLADVQATTQLARPGVEASGSSPRVLATSRFALTTPAAAASAEELRRDFDRLKTAFDAVSTLLSTVDLATLCERMLDAAFRLVPAEHGSVQLRRDDGTLWTAHQRSAGGEPVPTTISKTVVEHLLERREAVLAMDVGADPRFSGAASIQASRFVSLMAVPLLAGDDVLGILYVVNASQVGAFREPDLDLMSAIGVGAGLVLSNRHLYRQLEEALERQVAFNQTLKQTVELRTAELRDKNRQLSKTLTRLKATQDQIIAQEKLASLGTLTAGIAHELLNPMNFVNNFAGIIVEQIDELRGKLDERLAGETWPEGRELLDDIEAGSKAIHKHGARVQQIVAGMRQLSQANGGERTPTNLNGVLSNLVSALQHGEPSEGPRIVTALDPNMAEIHLAVRDVSCALLHVIQNAIQAVQARMAEPPAGWSPEVLIRSEDRRDAVQITVRDRGKGIPQEIRQRVFDPFFTTKPIHQGIGLGLSIAHDVIVKMHGGSIDISSEAGQFTELRITIPRKRRAERT
ncbi:hypothetical protein BE04_41355 [Sorangium cellulosum]|uniref:histidine kinase n=2 Tax=Sorangium cellulosum TaxID=56 RepID=A0A150PV86_SORCE|nr:ATP-binding protein [Sorangium cellulosum]AGP38366.1 hypothetical protein SCE1572_30105 [Sorangium cellulosum So0157-2]KYF59671.1 hypothetical protein BE04_41355 [Sorangium cellulosum]